MTPFPDLPQTPPTPIPPFPTAPGTAPLHLAPSRPVSAQWSFAKPSSRSPSSPHCSRTRALADWVSATIASTRSCTGRGLLTATRTGTRTRRLEEAGGPRPTPLSTAAATRPAPWVRTLQLKIVVYFAPPLQIALVFSQEGRADTATSTARDTAPTRRR
jgi:hypothetical protein